MSHPVDFVGLNRFIYDISGWDIDDKTLNPFYGTSDNTGLGREVKIVNGAATDLYVDQNHIGSLTGIERTDATRLYRNEQYPANLTHLPTYFTALMLYRNGPYGHPTWRQTRASHNPLSRRQRKHNVFTYYEEPGELIDKTDLSGKRVIQQNKKSKIIKKIEQPLSGKFKPLELALGVAPDDQEFGKCNDITLTLKSSHGNEINFFDNLSVAKYYDKDLDTSDNYENIKSLYLDGALDSEASPLQSFRFLRYVETIYPSVRNTYRNHIRMRPEYTFRWNDEIKERIEPGISLKNDPFFSNPGAIDNGFKFNVPYQSKWNIDAGWNFELFTGDRDNVFIAGIVSGAFDDYERTGNTRKSIGQTSKFTWPIGGANQLNNTYASYNYSYDEATPTGKNTAGGEGQLQNSYSLFADFRQISNSSGYVSDIDKVLSASCLYNRRHVVPSYYGLVAPSGMYIEELEQKKAQINPELIDIHESFGGATKWQVGETRKVLDKDGNLISAPLNPFYETYEKFAEHTKIVGKDYSLVPEFKISDHVETYEKIGLTEQNLKIFKVEGGLSGSQSSDKDNFYKVYSNSDFMEHFKVIKDDHSGFAEPSMITLQCKAIKKFLPYDGFYPNQRTEALSKQFVKSYSDHFKVVDCRTYEVTDPTELLPRASKVEYKFLSSVFTSASLSDTIEIQSSNTGDFLGTSTTNLISNPYSHGGDNTIRGQASPSIFNAARDQDLNDYKTFFTSIFGTPEIGSTAAAGSSYHTNGASTTKTKAMQLCFGSGHNNPVVLNDDSYPSDQSSSKVDPQKRATVIVNDINNNMVAFVFVGPEYWDAGGTPFMQGTVSSQTNFSGSWDTNHYTISSNVSRDYFFPAGKFINVGKQDGTIASGLDTMTNAVSKGLFWSVIDEGDIFGMTPALVRVY